MGGSKSQDTRYANILIVRPVYVVEKVPVKDQKLFHYGFRMLLYLVKHLRPNIANMTQELLKVMDGANQAAFLEIYQAIKLD